ncbi:MAG TPA: uroporphyrinogen-III synthase [Methylocella sp.]|nr:uroporphyrinogen-III synthase [Methylocella sp.]
MKDKTIAILEGRAREQMAELIRKRGGRPFSAPALAEVPDIDPAHIRELIHGWRSAPPDLFIFQTGVGTRAFLEAADRLGLAEDLLRMTAAALVVARGPKPAAILRARGVRIGRAAAEPYTTREVLAELQDIPLGGKRVAVQRYGESNRELRAALETAGAQVDEIVTYRWALPGDTAPLQQLIGALERSEIDLVAFTSAAQAANLFAVARNCGGEDSLRRNLCQTLVASVGPVCSAALRKRGVRVDIEAVPPKLGPLIDAIDAALSVTSPES